MIPVYSLCSSDVKQCQLSCWSCFLIQILRICAPGKINTLLQWVEEYKLDSFHREASSNPWKSNRFSQFSPKIRVKMWTHPFWQQLAHVAVVILVVLLQILHCYLCMWLSFWMNVWSVGGLCYPILLSFYLSPFATVISLIIDDLCYPFLRCIMQKVIPVQQ